MHCVRITQVLHYDISRNLHRSSPTTLKALCYLCLNQSTYLYLLINRVLNFKQNSRRSTHHIQRPNTLIVAISLISLWTTKIRIEFLQPVTDRSTAGDITGHRIKLKTLYNLSLICRPFSLLLQVFHRANQGAQLVPADRAQSDPGRA